jgi:CTP synthase (UTP-ammonia lyase)
MPKPVRIALVGDFNASVTAHRAIPLALQRSAENLRISVEPFWIHTTEISENSLTKLTDFDAIWCVPSSPHENMEGALAAIRFARENKIPFLGTFGGFQHALLELTRTVPRSIAKITAAILRLSVTLKLD